MPTDAFLEYIEEFEEVLEEAMKDIRSISSNKDGKNTFKIIRIR